MWHHGEIMAWRNGINGENNNRNNGINNLAA
jgi:hypothetical protein